MRGWVAVTVVLGVAVVGAQKPLLTEQDKADAIQSGTKAKGRLTGLSLLDSAQGFANAMASMSTTPTTTGSTGFSLRVYTPKTWVAQLASNAAKEYRPFAIADITEEMLEPVLRVVVYPDKPTHLVGGAKSSSAEHVVLRDEKKLMVVQPVSKEPFTETASSAMRDMAFEGLVAKFPLDSLRELRGPNGDKEFFIVVIGNGTREKEFKVKQKHFERLP